MIVVSPANYPDPACVCLQIIFEELFVVCKTVYPGKRKDK